MVNYVSAKMGRPAVLVQRKTYEELNMLLAGGDCDIAFISTFYTPIANKLWYIIIPIILMIDRELYVSGLREFLGTQKIEMPVPKKRFSMGKIKTTLQMISICAFLLWFVLGSFVSVASGGKFLFYAIYALPSIGIFGLWFSLVASIWSAAEYTKDFIGKLKKIK